jgi:hypothetical protein
LGQALLAGLRIDTAIAEMEGVVAEFLPEDAPLTDPNAVELLAQLARGSMFHDEHARSVALTDRALAVAERMELIPLVADLLVTRGTSLSHLGRSYEGVGAIKAGMDLARQQGLVVTDLRARVNVAVALNDSDPRAGLALTREALDMAKRLGRRSHARTLRANASEAAHDIGDWDWIVSELGAARDDEVEELGRNFMVWILFRTHAFRGEDVNESLEMLNGWAKSLDDRSAEEGVHGLIAEAAVGRLDWAVAFDEYMRFALSDTLNARRTYASAGLAALLLHDPVRAHKALDLHIGTGIHGAFARMDEKLIHAGIAALEGRTTPALAEFREVLAGLMDLGLEFRVAIAGLAMAAVLPGDMPEVRAAADAAGTIFTRLRAKPLLEALDRATTSAPSGGAPTPASTAASRVPAR